MLRPCFPLLIAGMVLGAFALCACAQQPEVTAAKVLSAPRAPAGPVEPATPQLAKPDELLVRFPVIDVVKRKEKMDSYPCSQCHDDSMEPDPKERVLKESHDEIVLVHGGGRFWCTTCHGATKDKDSLVSIKGEKIDFDQQFLLCGQCHFRQQREFFFGAHGKRIESWRGDHKALGCTACHNPHNPSIKPREPWRGPDATR